MSAAAARPTIPITVVSDVLCPWCWIGKRSIELAANEAQVSIDLHWKPYLLDPSLPREGVDKLQHYVKKFGARAQAMVVDPNNPLNQRGRPMGLEYTYHEGSKVFDSLPAHRLLYFARSKFGSEAQNRVQEVLFRRYFKDGENLGGDSALLEAAKEAGLPEEQTKAYLASTEDFDVVKAEVRKAQQVVDGVPFFTFPSGKQISGGEAVTTFAQVLKKEASLLKQ
jgi:predicted DsbA family dithiol-disulfide isomerase